MKVERHIEIDVPRQKLYEALMDPRALKDWVTIHKKLKDAPAGSLKKGSELAQELKVAGRTFTVEWKVTENDRPSRVVWEGRGPLGTKASIRFELEETEAGTRFSYANDYEVPGGALGRLAGRAVSGAAGKETEKSLAKLKKLLEG